jgi:hypothetical protein
MKLKIPVSFITTRRSVISRRRIRAGQLTGRIDFGTPFKEMPTMINLELRRSRGRPCRSIIAAAELANRLR